MSLFVIFILLALGLAFYNGFFLRGDSDAWHGIGWIFRALPMIWLYPDLAAMAIYFFVAWILYDLIINLMIGQKWYYMGGTSRLERSVPAFFWVMAKIALTFGTVAAVLIKYFGL